MSSFPNLVSSEEQWEAPMVNHSIPGELLSLEPAPQSELGVCQMVYAPED